jgi:AcrR family transcriptional regulator
MQLLYERKADRGNPMLHSAHAHRRMPLQKRSRDRLEHLLATAEHMMVERGYERVNTNLIARIAGIPVGSICYLFSNKDQTLCLLVARAFELHVNEIAAANSEKALACSCEEYYRQLLQVVERVWWMKRQLILLWHSMPYIAGQQQVVQSFIPGIERLPLDRGEPPPGAGGGAPRGRSHDQARHNRRDERDGHSSGSGTGSHNLGTSRDGHRVRSLDRRTWRRPVTRYVATWAPSARGLNHEDAERLESRCNNSKTRSS